MVGVVPFPAVVRAGGSAFAGASRELAARGGPTEGLGICLVGVSMSMYATPDLLMVRLKTELQDVCYAWGRLLRLNQTLLMPAG